MEAGFGEVLTSCEKLRYTIKHGEKCLRPEKRYVPMLLMTKSARVEYRPYGVIGIIIPWNYPYGAWAIIILTGLSKTKFQKKKKKDSIT